MSLARIKIDIPVEEAAKPSQPKKPFNPILWNAMIASWLVALSITWVLFFFYGWGCLDDLCFSAICCFF